MSIERFLNELNSIKDPETALKHCLEYLEAHATAGDELILTVADRAVHLAERLHDDSAEFAARCFRGLGLLARHMELQRRAAADAPDADELDAAIGQLDEAYHFFTDRLRQSPPVQEQNTAHPGSPSRREGWRKRQGKGSRKKKGAAAQPPDVVVRTALALGWAYAQKDEPAQSLRWQLIALLTAQLAALHDARGAARPTADAREAIGGTYCAMGDYAVAQAEFEQCHALRQEAADEGGTARALSLLGEVHMAQGNLDAAEDLYRQSHDLYVRIGMPYEAAVAMSRRAQVQCEAEVQAREARARQCCRPALKAAEELALRAGAMLQEFADTQTAESGPFTEVYDHLARNTITLGQLANQRGATAAAFAHYALAHTLAEQHCSPRLLLPILLDVGRLHREQGQEAEFIQAFENAIEIARTINDWRLEYQLHEELAAYYEGRGWWREALREYRQFAELRHTVAGERARVAAQVQRIKSETELREHEAKRLRERNTLLENLIANLESGANLPKDEKRTLLVQRWPLYQKQLEEEHPGFLQRLKARVRNLTSAEVEVSGLLRLRKTNDEIIQIRGNNKEGNYSQRLSIRRKLGLRGRTRTLEDEIQSI